MADENYKVYNFDNLSHGYTLKMEHSVHTDENNIVDLVSKPLDEVCAMRDESTAAEDAAFGNVKHAFKEWEKQAAVTQQIDRALEYLQTPEVSHTSNQWQKDDYGNFNCISNKVYKMTYRFFEYSSYRTGDKKRCEVSWWVSTNSPKAGWSLPIAEQKRSFASREEAEKYMQGRIKSYSHLFTEICPVVPKKYANSFRLHGQPLRGYVIEGMEPVKDAPKSEKAEKKPSIRKQLKQNTEKSVSSPQPEKVKSKGNIEL